MIPCTIELTSDNDDDTKTKPVGQTPSDKTQTNAETSKNDVILDPKELPTKEQDKRPSWVNISIEQSDPTRRDSQEQPENGRTPWLLDCMTCFRKRKFGSHDENKSTASWSSSSLRQFIKKSKFTRCSFYKNNISFFLAIFVFLIIQVVLVIIQMQVYSKASIYIKLARANGILLDFNSSLIIFLVLRRMITWIRDSKIGRAILPLDDFIMFHKIIGFLILVVSIFHTIAHCVNLYHHSEEYRQKIIEETKKKSFVTKLFSSSRMDLDEDSMESLPTTVSTTSLSTSTLNDSRERTEEMITPVMSNTQTTLEFDFISERYTTLAASGNGSDSEIPESLGYLAELMFTTKSKVGWVGGTAMPTGWALLAILFVMVLFSLPCIRRRGHFEIFYWTHRLYVVYYILLILHCQNYWKWFLLPFLLILIEMTVRFIKVNSKYHGSGMYIKDVVLLPSNVTQLIINRPKNVRFKSGDYLYINIPEIARYEWHPFTISSAPELKDEIWLHVRSLGNWTKRLHEFFSNFSRLERRRSIFHPSKVRSIIKSIRNAQPPNDSPKVNDDVTMIKYTKSDIQSYEIKLNVSNKIENVFVNVYTDGPYSTASRHIFDSEHAILIAGGIGVTPFASILQSIWFRYVKSLKRCSKCSHEWYDDIEEKSLKRVDFIWVNRDYQSFEWFIELLSQLESQQLKLDKRFIGIHLYMTSAKVEQEINACDFLPNVNVPGVDRSSTSSESCESSSGVESCENGGFNHINTSTSAITNVGPSSSTTTTSTVDSAPMSSRSSSTTSDYYEHDDLDEATNAENGANLNSFALKLYPGRPDLDKLFQSFASEKYGKKHVYFCGNGQFGNFVQKKCIKHKFKFSKEYF